MASPPFDHAPLERLRRMLLGELPDGEREELEARLLEDPELFEAYEAAEGSLLDALVRGELPAEEARRLEAVFASSTEGRAKLAVARELARGESRPDRFRLLRFPRGPKSWMALAAVLVLSVLSGWLAVENQRLREQREVLVRRQSVDATVTLELPLARLSRRSGGEEETPTAELPGESADLALVLDLQGLPAHPTYRISIRDSAGELVYAEAGLRPPEPEALLLKVAVPAWALAPGPHQVALDGETAEGGWELVAETPILILP